MLRCLNSARRCIRFCVLLNSRVHDCCPYSSSKRKHPASPAHRAPADAQCGFVSPDESSPFVLSTLSRSPPKRSRHPSESSEYTTESSSMAEEEGRTATDVLGGSVKVRAALLERQLRGLEATRSSSDSGQDSEDY